MPLCFEDPQRRKKRASVKKCKHASLQARPELDKSEMSFEVKTVPTYRTCWSVCENGKCGCKVLACPKLLVLNQNV